MLPYAEEIGAKLRSSRFKQVTGSSDPCRRQGPIGTIACKKMDIKFLLNGQSAKKRGTSSSNRSSEEKIWSRRHAISRPEKEIEAFREAGRGNTRISCRQGKRKTSKSIYAPKKLNKKFFGSAMSILYSDIFPTRKLKQACKFLFALPHSRLIAYMRRLNIY